MFDHAEAERVIEMAKRNIDSSLMIVFGSVVNGTADKDSDLDIIIVKESDENSFIIGAEARLALEDSNIPVDIIVYTPEEFKRDLSNKYSLAHEAMATGRVIHGSV
ncbi:MAG: nucleotidyltransferase domain-containing protein [Methanomassiliicoccaceae archaeon]|nr:nucleotidyltransferase domain-containing protein [Methanomassiliicoccaceae archaeon]